MIKYDEYLEVGREKLRDLTSRWKELIEEIKTKEQEKEQLEDEDLTLSKEIEDLEAKRKILENAPKEIIASILINTLLFGGLVVFAIGCIHTGSSPWDDTWQAQYVATTRLVLDLMFGALGISLGIMQYNTDTKSIREVEKIYTLEKLIEELEQKKKLKENSNNRLKNISKELEEAYEEKETLKEAIVSLNNSIKELEKRRMIAIDSILLPDMSEVLDESFNKDYGETNPLDYGARVREK